MWKKAVRIRSVTAFPELVGGERTCDHGHPNQAELSQGLHALHISQSGPPQDSVNASVSWDVTFAERH